MSRSGYTDDYDEDGKGGLWRGAVKRALEVQRGQAFLRELVAALDAMPEKTLVAGELEAEGEFCALGVVGRARGIDLSKLNTWDRSNMAEAFGIAEALAAEVMYENDEGVDSYTWIDVEVCGPMRPWRHERHQRSVSVPLMDVAAKRWHHMRAWAVAHLKTPNVEVQPRLHGDGQAS